MGLGAQGGPGGRELEGPGDPEILLAEGRKLRFRWRGGFCVGSQLQVSGGLTECGGFRFQGLGFKILQG